MNEQEIMNQLIKSYETLVNILYLCRTHDNQTGYYKMVDPYKCLGLIDARLIFDLSETVKKFNSSNISKDN